jgi:acyl-CoA synthetase (AMP-forming)/AMP-acid ligase II
VPEDLGHDTIAMLQYTSGSTGAPKGVLISHGNLLHNAGTQQRAFALTADTRVGGWIPHYHDMGLHGHLLPMLVVGGSCVLMRSSAFLKRPHQWLQTIDRYDIHVSAAPNFAYELCCARVTDDQLAGLDLSRWRIAVSGSEPIDAAVLDAFAKRLAPAGFRDDVLCPCYGMAETTLFVSGEAHRKPTVTKVDVHGLRANRFVPAAAGADLVSCGTPYDYDMVIADPLTGEPVAPGVIGEIWLRGPSISPGYWRNEIPAGYLRTGDLGALHDGELYVTGRLAEVMTVDGRLLYPQDVERELRSRHAELVGGGAVFTVDGVLIVTHEVGGRLTDAARRRLARRIGQTVAEEFGVSVGGVVLLRRGELRRTTSGKIQRVAMRRLFLAGDLTVE